MNKKIGISLCILSLLTLNSLLCKTFICLLEKVDFMFRLIIRTIRQKMAPFSVFPGQKKLFFWCIWKIYRFTKR